ncbi:hypothetical protein GGS23DRAFT_589484 [Durotheca rogersii]|uniref:uncharacterized protein n=1 Tax=Durotheca rogersii TaxID=419775 RepID=UPI00221E4F52|nr:uncharacterized protein GGS23DRAFT_589484 [Durotheca rogersii]KAI5855589.1 hypothetical protein GGS23DRAFT_589484 [Durotheca rogersii]
MSSKRKFSEFEGDGARKEQPKSRGSIPEYSPPETPQRNGKKSKAKPGSVNWIKKRARTIERRFKAGQTLPANIQNDLERELAHHQQKLSEIAMEKKKKHMIKKYHMVRFFERKKADRLAKQIQSQLEAAEDEGTREKLGVDLHRAKIDSLYARFFPYMERYISLYPVASPDLVARGGEKSEDASSAAQALHTERPPLWRDIEKASESGTPALLRIRDRKSDRGSISKRNKGGAPKRDIPANGNVASSQQGKGEGKSKPKRDEASNLSNDSDSEGGFFAEG